MPKSGADLSVGHGAFDGWRSLFRVEQKLQQRRKELFLAQFKLREQPQFQFRQRKELQFRKRQPELQRRLEPKLKFGQQQWKPKFFESERKQKEL